MLPAVYNYSGEFSDSIKENGKALTNLFIWFFCLPVHRFRSRGHSFSHHFGTSQVNSLSNTIDMHIIMGITPGVHVFLHTESSKRPNSLSFIITRSTVSYKFPNYHMLFIDCHKQTKPGWFE